MKINSFACPYCNGAMDITEIQCTHCHTTIRGHFERNAFNRLSEKELELAYRFIEHGGNLKELEKVYNISYPTLKNRINALIESLTGKTVENTYDPLETLDLLESGDLNVEEALKRLKGE
ncbi:MAG: DUF2089 domain-containing protein [Tissierellia bacterium]|nr:DUF2089 domain-containing protein [Tissierellia bacterium]